ncbi:hypothetical protein [Allorhodopirellula heiligendammensis]|uniref:Phage virion morphogenesis family protein n=1 Tax=Allorhodopirellula heiligendammensis TaxID=2714739 RepID=A0A5C6C394_9BACT|nr:hypothetical protein [Allorhodopirellula heiligendammensis]TWU17986.1 hypothetical protein Poly21_01390 [Allorhodopirellula heiligendammensis]
MTTVTWKIKGSFFDRPRVQRSVDRAVRRELSRAGAFVRRTARSSIRPVGKRAKSKKKKGQRVGGLDPTISRPGQPPRMHTKGAKNIRTILFGYQPGPQSVVIGPVLFKSKNGVNVPQLLEHGGTGKVLATSRRKNRGGHATRRLTAARYKARPFMFPALQKEAPKFPNLFRNSIK